MLQLFLSWLMPLAMAAGVISPFIGEDKTVSAIALTALPLLTVIFRDSLKLVFGTTVTLEIRGRDD